MPWRCPACKVAIRATEYAPQPNLRYRCPICHLELRFDPLANHMVMAPLPSDASPPPVPLAVERRAHGTVDRRARRSGGRRASDARTSMSRDD